ncbi:hypothetical protein L486_00437 [Kwoniella mangroviensis CBS 10435]|uniref:Zn(2)-C6 fungal-type domain-containing protein n=1 Tax=Kwoniella mangroviensis CBS 10435 TaxID=1331196 RepID=A0A1B9IZ42_9TREE|nr:uncharacterized protein I203_06244 [Kwoniella mangroviensis CBS 8507]OCF60797.1 hypothetical protein L486_00437 [Kwoniella mangroviensis CBS 10435]OCF64513.1 hypothetical protein I203_06244 [Kwoniella mangroviensis CBS 8507]OCF74454.1 hypothetical protein I204_04829 [Kwoniella mangroviensis CBS 8886]
MSSSDDRVSQSSSVPLSNSLDRRPSGHDGEQPRPAKKRKQRQQFSCAECRRLKLKCDRQIPCANCVRRACGHLCPERERPQANIGSNGLLTRLETLEGVLQQHGIPLPAEPGAVQPPQQSATQPPPSMTHSDTSKHHTSPPQRRPSPVPQTVVPTFSMDEFTATTMSHSPLARAGSALSELADAATSTQQAADAVPDQQIESDVGPPMPQPELHHVRFDFGTPTAETLNMYRHAQGPFQQDSPENQSHGTLVISQGGRSKYLGPTAASEWLKDQEIHEPMESPCISRMPSPERQGNSFVTPSFTALSTVPFPFRNQQMSTAELLAALPPTDEGTVLVDCYYRYFAWHFDIVPRAYFQPMFNRMYLAVVNTGRGQQPKVAPQELGLVYIVFAMGALHSLELRPNDPLAENYCNLAKICLAKADFLVNTTLAGVQALHIMAHYMLETERGRNGDSAWPLWGMAMRLLQAMGVHRDGARWNLPHEVVEERRRVFWESYSVDVFQANCFSRPCSLSLDYVDTAFPSHPGLSLEKDFFTLKFELSRISAAILDRAMKVNETPYSKVNELHQRLCDFERLIPFRLRCRAALLALPSVYSNTEAAVRDSPPITQSNLILSLQQCTLAINISEAVLFLHRPFYARAMYESEDPTRSSFGLSFLAVVERCHVIISVVAGIYALHPNVCARHWFFWYHVFNSAVCLGTLIFRNPNNPLVGFALSQVDSTIGLYTAVVQVSHSKRILHNLRWLLRLRAQAIRKVQKSSGEMGGTQPGADLGEESDDENVELIGLKTRLIERASRGTQTAKTILQVTPAASGITESPSNIINDTISLALQDILYSSETSGQNAPTVSKEITSNNDVNDSSTNDLLHEFWDPMMLQDFSEKDGPAFTDSNWWNWDSSVIDSGTTENS